jgi:hypothetical protein
VTLYHLATDRQPHTSPLVNGSTVQALEGDEEALEVLSKPMPLSSMKI